MKKTNAIRILELRGINVNSVSYQVNENEIDAESIAIKLGLNPEQVFKTLVTVGSDKNNYVFVIPGNYELDLKKAASASGVKKIELIKMKDLLSLTGYVRGGCSPIGMKKLFPTFIDESAQLFGEIYVSAGVRGMQISISPTDLAEIVSAKFCGLI
jgi:Cys-tRNA(Pro)/Cys-tRNA(Cys) deacylase